MHDWNTYLFCLKSSCNVIAFFIRHIVIVTFGGAQRNKHLAWWPLLLITADMCVCVAMLKTFLIALKFYFSWIQSSSYIFTLFLRISLWMKLIVKWWPQFHFYVHSWIQSYLVNFFPDLIQQKHTASRNDPYSEKKRVLLFSISCGLIIWNEF